MSVRCPLDIDLLLLQFGDGFAIDDALLLHFDRFLVVGELLFLSASDDAFLQSERRHAHLTMGMTSLSLFLHFFFLFSRQRFDRFRAFREARVIRSQRVRRGHVRILQQFTASKPIALEHPEPKASYRFLLVAFERVDFALRIGGRRSVATQAERRLCSVGAISSDLAFVRCDPEQVESDGRRRKGNDSSPIDRLFQVRCFAGVDGAIAERRGKNERKGSAWLYAHLMLFETHFDELLGERHDAAKKIYKQRQSS